MFKLMDEKIFTFFTLIFFFCLSKPMEGEKEKRDRDGEREREGEEREREKEREGEREKKRPVMQPFGNMTIPGSL